MNFEELKRSTQRGFNTWYNNSVLTHALLPQGIGISLGFKYFNSGRVIREALIGRFGENEEKIHPGPRSYDGAYTELSVSYGDHVTRVETTVMDGELYILVTPVKNCPMPPLLLVSAAMLWNKPGWTKLENGRLVAVTPDRTVEVFAGAPPVRQLNTGITGPYLAVELSRPIAVSSGGLMTAAELRPILDNRKKTVMDECRAYGGLAECYNAMRTCLAWDTIYEPENEQICSPVSRLWSIGWGGYVLFDWDTYFSAMIAMVENRDLAYANAIAITHEKTGDGFVPNVASADNFKSRDRSEPPVGALAVRELYRKYRETWLVEYLFDDLLGWNRWWTTHRMLENGQLCWGSDPIYGQNIKWWQTKESGVHGIQGAKYESGLDNSPMYDDVPFNETTNMMELADVGLTGLYILDCECLAELADLIGREDEGAELRGRAERSKDGLEELWDEKFGLYLNKRTDTGEFSYRVSPTNFYALFSDRVTKERAERMIDRHFFNPDEFLGEFMLPAIARADPAYKDQEYWRGRIWGPLNFLCYLALRRREWREARKVLAGRSEKLIMREWLDKGHVHENYNADTGEGCDIGSSDKFYHWGGLLSLIALMEAGYVEGPEQPLPR